MGRGQINLRRLPGWRASRFVKYLIEWPPQKDHHVLPTDTMEGTHSPQNRVISRGAVNGEFTKASCRRGAISRRGMMMVQLSSKGLKAPKVNYNSPGALSSRHNRQGNRMLITILWKKMPPAALPGTKLLPDLKERV